MAAASAPACLQHPGDARFFTGRGRSSDLPGSIAGAAGAKPLRCTYSMTAMHGNARNDPGASHSSMPAVNAPDAPSAHADSIRRISTSRHCESEIKRDALRPCQRSPRTPVLTRNRARG